MLSFSIQFLDKTINVLTAVKSAAFKNFSHAAASIRKDVIASILPSPEASKPGTPPHTRAKVSRKGKQLKGVLQKAITFHADSEGAVIGPRASVAGTSGKAHEFGGTYKGQEFPQRAFMFPGLKRNLGRFASDWAGSV